MLIIVPRFKLNEIIPKIITSFMTCIGITGALRSTPTASMEMVLHLQPLNITSIATKSAIRPQESRHFGKKPPMDMGK